MKTSTVVILAIGAAAAIYLLTQNPANALIPGANDNSGAGGAGGDGSGGGTGTQSLTSQMRRTGGGTPFHGGTVFGTGTRIQSL